MLATTDLRGSPLDRRTLRAALPRAEFDLERALAAVEPICRQVQTDGAAALLELTERFDRVRPTRLRVPAEALQVAAAGLAADVRTALETSIQRAEKVHAAQLPAQPHTQVSSGGSVAQRWIPVERVGLYVPGGRAVYPSSVVMNVVPARVAGVPSIAVASPPQRDNPPQFAGLPHPTIMAACHLLGISEVYAIGGAQAVAAFAYGFLDTTDPAGPQAVEPVSLVTGPGNIYVAAAKRYLAGVIGIDAEAGPTEIAILADETADPELVASDLVSQAEHDPLAAAVLVTDSAWLAEQTKRAVQRRAAAAKHSQRILEALSGKQSGVVLVDDLDAGVAVVNAYAAEHLEVITKDAPAIAARVTNAGAVFVGGFSPVSLGDYAAGSNHVLPTGGSAVHASGLNVHSFLRSVQVITYDQGAVQQVAASVIALAEAEDLPAHGKAITARLGAR